MRYDELALHALEELGCATTSEITRSIEQAHGLKIRDSKISHALNVLGRYGLVTLLGSTYTRTGSTLRWRLSA